jgi:ribosome-associated heat shock protein Hsp15
MPGSRQAVRPAIGAAADPWRWAQRCERSTQAGRRDASSTRGIIGRVTDPNAADETRIDRWLCAVRLVKTRPLATQLCEGGHVLVNGSPAKPSTRVRAGDRIEARIADRERTVEVVRPIESRVGAPAAATCYVDHSPPVVTRVAPGMMRIRGEGRPGKRLRRELERLRRSADT